MDCERLFQRFVRYITCSSESFHERAFCLMMEQELMSLGLQVERQEIGAKIGSDGWNIHAFLPGTGEPCCCVHIWTPCRPASAFSLFWQTATSVLLEIPFWLPMIRPELRRSWRL